MERVEINPIPHDLLVEIYPFVFDNEFEKREINFAIDLPFHSIATEGYYTCVETTGSYTCVEMTNSKGEIELAHFWGMDGDYRNGYKPKYCYSFKKNSGY